MLQAILAFTIYLVIQVGVFFVGINLVKKEETFTYSYIMRTYVIGQMMVFSIIQILAVPMILTRQSFNVLYYSFLCVFFLFLIIGIVRFFKGGIPRIPSIIKYFRTLSPITIIFMIISALIILAQFLIYFFCLHLDEDDARWMAEANDALAYGDMMTRDVNTGNYIGSFVVAKDTSSPWPMMWAILAKFLHIRTPIAVHTIYASFELIVLYMVYYLIARELFEKKDSRFVFIISVAVINLFFAGGRHTQSVFSLVRIWQGKATVAAIVIPLILYIFICINKRNEMRDWLFLPIICCGASLMSGMGVSISIIMLGIYGLYNIIVFKNLKKIPVWILSLVPGAIFAIVYFYFKR